MAATDQAKEAAELLYSAHQSRQVFEPLPDTLAPRSVEGLGSAHLSVT
jgi:hypothetical protein